MQGARGGDLDDGGGVDWVPCALRGGGTLLLRLFPELLMYFAMLKLSQLDDLMPNRFLTLDVLRPSSASPRASPARNPPGTALPLGPRALPDNDRVILGDNRAASRRTAVHIRPMGCSDHYVPPG